MGWVGGDAWEKWAGGPACVLLFGGSHHLNRPNTSRPSSPAPVGGGVNFKTQAKKSRQKA